MGKGTRQAENRGLGGGRPKGRHGSRNGAREDAGVQAQKAGPSPPTSLEAYAAGNRATHSGKCSFCRLPESAHTELQTILEKNRTGEWCLSIASAWRWFREQHGYVRGAESFRNHVRRCLGHEWTKR